MGCLTEESRNTAAIHKSIDFCYSPFRGCHGHDRMVVGFTTTCASSANHHLSCEFESRSWQGYRCTRYNIMW